MSNEVKKTPDFSVYVIVGNKPNEYWNRIGSAWNNKDGSINVQLNALPIDGKIQLRAPKENEEQQ